MSTFLKRIHLLSIGLGSLTVVGVVFNLLMFILLYPKVTQMQPIGGLWETLGIVVGLNVVIIALFHLSAVLSLLLYIVRQRTFSIVSILAIVLGILSGLLILADLTMLQEIGKQYELAWETSGEWTILFVGYALHTLFLILALTRLIANLETAKRHQPEAAIKDEVLFLALHHTGWVCSAWGILAILLAWLLQVPIWILQEITVTIGSIILLPYLVVLGLWLYRQRIASDAGCLDEKQWQDLSQAGFGSLLLTMPCMLLVYMLQISSANATFWSLLWLPAYLLLSLFLFSTLTMIAASLTPVYSISAMRR